MSLKNIATHFYLYLFMLFGLSAQAEAKQGNNFINPKTTGVSTVNYSNGQNLVIAKPNQHGISFNKFSRFEIENELKIINIQTSNENDSVAKTIVISAPSIILKKKIQLIGPKADLIFIATKSNINCSNCRFDNLYRVTLATAKDISISASTTAIGDLTIQPNQSLSVSNLQAPGVISIDLLSNKLALAGKNSTHQAVRKSNNNGYISDENGRQLLGGGAFNIYYGAMKWNYESQRVKEYGNHADVASLSGSINSTTINMVTTKNLTVNTTINTTSDLVATTYYRGKSRVNVEGFNLERVYPLEGNLNLSNKIHSKGSVSIKTSGDLTFTNKTNYDADSIEIMTTGSERVGNFGQLFGFNVSIAAEGTFENHGKIEAISKIEIYSNPYTDYLTHNKTGIFNGRNGKLLADTIALESNGNIQNGESGLASEKIPGISRPSKLSRPIYYQSGLGIGRHGNTIPITERTKKIGFLSSLEEPQLEIDVNTPSESKIIANNILIKGQNFLNINPYFTDKIADDGSVSLEISRLNQVSVSAEENLTIIVKDSNLGNRGTSGNVRNVSALMSVNSPSGLFQLDAKSYFINERYIIVNGLETNVFEAVSKTLVYSPPGRFLSMGNVKAKARYVINNISYFEVFDSATFDAESFDDIGIIHNKIGIDTRLEIITPALCNHRRCKESHYVLSSDIVNSNVNALDSLLFIQNNFHGPSVDYYGRDLSPLDEYIYEAVRFFAKDIVTAPTVEGDNPAVVYEVTSIDKNNNLATVKATTYTTTYQSGGLGLEVINRKDDETATHTIIDLVIKYYKKAVEKINEFLEYLGL